LTILYSFIAERLSGPLFKLMLFLLGGAAMFALFTGNFSAALMIIPHMLSMVMILLCMRFIWSAPGKLLRKSIASLDEDGARSNLPKGG